MRTPRSFQLSLSLSLSLTTDLHSDPPDRPAGIPPNSPSVRRGTGIRFGWPLGRSVRQARDTCGTGPGRRAPGPPARDRCDTGPATARDQPRTGTARLRDRAQHGIRATRDRAGTGMTGPATARGQRGTAAWPSTGPAPHRTSTAQGQPSTVAWPGTGPARHGSRATRRRDPERAQDRSSSPETPAPAQKPPGRTRVVRRRLQCPVRHTERAGNSPAVTGTFRMPLDEAGAHGPVPTLGQNRSAKRCRSVVRAQMTNAEMAMPTTDQIGW